MTSVHERSLGRGPRRWAIPMLAMACALAGVSGRAEFAGLTEPKAIAEARNAELPRKTAGKAVVERLGPVLIDGAGMLVGARAGDWRLSNERMSFTFAAVDSSMTSNTHPIAGEIELAHPQHRIPGALIDVTAGGDPLDILGYFTQGVGLRESDARVEYDLAEAVAREGEVGLRLEGSPFENSLVRLETTYWLGEGADCLRVESRLLNLRQPEPMPAFCDVMDWGWAGVLVARQGYASGNQLLDFTSPLLSTHAGELTLGLSLPGGQLTGAIKGSPKLSRTLWLPAEVESKGDEEALDRRTSDTARVEPRLLNVSTSAVLSSEKVFIRELWLTRGAQHQLLGKVLAAHKIPTGVVQGKVTTARDGKPAANADIHVLWLISRTTETLPPLYAVARTDQNGDYSINLPPGRFFMIPVSSTIKRGVGLSTTVDVEAGKTLTKDLAGRSESRLRVRVYDGATSKPIPARLIFEPLNPGRQPAAFFGLPERAGGYLNKAYVTAEGGEFNLAPGTWFVKAGNGLRYDLAEAEAEVIEADVTETSLTLTLTNPTPGWIGLEQGARTKATPGVTVSAEDMVLMAAAEGIDWLISGDFETLTDFTPIIQKMGFKDAMRGSRGFRTLLPAHPEWGQFFVYPVAADAPDPARARSQWAELRDPTEFLATLRRLYPGAIIQSDLPFTMDGQGFLGFGKAPWDSAPDPLVGRETGVDALNIFPARQPGRLSVQESFWFDHMMLSRFFLPATGPTGRTVLGSEPGFPRALVYVGSDNVAEVNEQQWLKAMREGRLQITNAPFIDFKVTDQIAGGRVPFDLSLPYQLRVTSPIWAPPDDFSIDKEGQSQRKIMGAPAEGHAQFWPSDLEKTHETGRLADLKLMDIKETMLGVRVHGRTPIQDVLIPCYPGETFTPYAISYPILVDKNGNGKFDPPEQFSWKGR